MTRRTLSGRTGLGNAIVIGSGYRLIQGGAIYLFPHYYQYYHIIATMLSKIEHDYHTLLSYTDTDCNLQER